MKANQRRDAEDAEGAKPKRFPMFYSANLCVLRASALIPVLILQIRDNSFR